MNPPRRANNTRAPAPNYMRGTGPIKSETVSIAPTGEQYEIVSGGRRAVITEVGATLRSYAVDGIDVVRGFAEDAVVQGGRGQNLIPWPNRIRDGKYTFAGQPQQPVSEFQRGEAVVLVVVGDAGKDGRSVVVRRQSGVIVVRAMPEELRAVLRHR